MSGVQRLQYDTIDDNTTAAATCCYNKPSTDNAAQQYIELGSDHELATALSDAYTRPTGCSCDRIRDERDVQHDSSLNPIDSSLMPVPTDCTAVLQTIT